MADAIDYKLYTPLDYRAMLSQRVCSIEVSIVSMSASDMKRWPAAARGVEDSKDQIKHIVVPKFVEVPKVQHGSAHRGTESSVHRSAKTSQRYGFEADGKY